MNKDVIDQLILNAKREAIASRILRISFGGVYVVRSKNHPFYRIIYNIQCKYGPVESFKPVIPKDVENSGFAHRRVANQAHVIGQHSSSFSHRARVLTLISAEI
ncbi:MAG: hypothetical protein H0T95_05115 [Chthoniobacterales bacterium]|nr:hypothetical protein [Chthoniobacterales bacterium]